jgi:release factor glutamine methyltransferase
MSLDAALRRAGRALTAASVPSPAADAELLLAHVLGRDVGDLRRDRVLGGQLPPQAESSFEELVRRRCARVPVQHLTGTAHFAGLELKVGPGVFVPRPETEVLVALALRSLDGLIAPTVVDLCTGSGAVALALAVARPDARVGAVELSAAAYRYARANVSATGLPVDLRQGAAQDAFADWSGAVDLVVSNPPYIPPDAVPVEVEVAEHDPELALYGGGTDGLDVPRGVADRAAVLLRPGGVLLMEHADAQGRSLPEALRHRGWWVQVSDHVDLSGRPRVTRAVRAGTHGGPPPTSR